MPTLNHRDNFDRTHTEGGGRRDLALRFVILAPGPLFGVLAMLRLRQLLEAIKIAHGRR